MNLDLNVAKPIAALLNYYGGHLADKLDESCTHALLTLPIKQDSNGVDDLREYLSAMNLFDETIFEKVTYSSESANEKENEGNLKLKVITPDWIISCVNEKRIVDEHDFNPIFLSNLFENKTYNSNQSKVDENVSQQMTNDESINIESEAKKQHIFKLNTSSTVIKDRLAQLNQQQPSDLDKFDESLNTSIILNGSLSDKSKAKNDAIQSDDASQSSMNTPTKKRRQRARKTSQNGTSTTSNGNGTTTTNAFSLDMNDIFQSVISASEESEVNKNTRDDKQTKHSSTNNNNNNNNNNNSMSSMIAKNGVLPIYLNLLRPTFNTNQPNEKPFTFDEDSSSMDQYHVQENSNLLKFNRCLLGCVFYIKPSLNIYTQDCLNDWEDVINRFGGTVSNDYTPQVTHVLCPNRSVDIFKRAIADKKRVVTAYWLEDVLQEQKMRPPWLAYHFPSPYELKDGNSGPLVNHIISTHGFSGKEKLILKTLIWLMNGKYSSYLTNINSFLISKNTTGIKYEKAKKWNIPVVNGVWLSELYLGNMYCLTKNLSDRYTNINQINFNKVSINVNHFAYDALYVNEFMEAWKTLIKLPMDQQINQQQQKEPTNEELPLKQLNRNSPLKRHNRSISPQSPNNEYSQNNSSSNPYYSNSKKR